MARYTDIFDGTNAELAELEATENRLGITVRPYRPAEFGYDQEELARNGWTEIFRLYRHTGATGNLIAYHLKANGVNYVELWAPEGEATAQIVASAVKAARAAFEKIAA